MEIYIDLEKTLLGQENQLSEKTYISLKKLAQEHKCTILTTDSLFAHAQLLTIPNIKIVSSLENKLYQNGVYEFTSLNTKDLDSLLFDEGIYTLYALSNKCCYILKYQERLKLFYPAFQLKIETHFPKDLAAIQMVVFQKDLERILKTLEAYHIEILASDYTKVLLNVSSTPSTKESWLLRLKKSPALGIGDSLSDYSFIKHCEVQVAMKNADEELKALCKQQTAKTNDEDGAIEFILSFLKHQQV